MSHRHQPSTTAAADGLQLGSGLRRIVCLAALLFIFVAGVRADVAINETTFPDDNFRNWVLGQEYGADGILTDEEIAGVKNINVSNKEIKDLTGIGFFTALTYLDCSYNEQLTFLDVSGCTALTQLWCEYNQLTELDVSKNTALDYLACRGNQLTELDVSKNAALTQLICSSNELTSLVVSGCTALKVLWCDDNQLTSIDLSDCRALTELLCYGNKIRGDGMTDLVNNLPDRETASEEGSLKVYYSETPTGNSMTPGQVEVATSKNWSVLRCDADGWIAYEGDAVSYGLEISETTFPDDNFRNWVLGQEYGADGILTDEEIAGVKNINVSNKEIKDLTGIGFFTALEKLYCYINELTELDVSNNTALYDLRCGRNELTSLNVSGCTSLETLDCTQNQLTSLDISDNTALEYLNCSYNKQLTSLVVSHHEVLRELRSDDCQLAELDVSGCTALTQLWCEGNRLTELNVSKNTALEYLACHRNKLTELDVSKNAALTQLLCSFNQLTSLVVSGCTALKTLWCERNQLTSIDLSDCMALTELMCYGNKIRGKGMTDFVNNLPDRKTASEEGSLKVYYKESSTCNLITPGQVKIATDKNWGVYKDDGSGWVPYEGDAVPGDANGDGEVNALDVDCLRDYVLGLDPQPFSFESANLNGDSEVDIQDLTQLIQLLTE